MERKGLPWPAGASEEREEEEEDEEEDEEEEEGSTRASPHTAQQNVIEGAPSPRGRCIPIALPALTAGLRLEVCRYVYSVQSAVF